MSYSDQLAYKRHIENQRIELSVTETAIDKGKRKAAIEIAKNLLSIGLNIRDIAEATKLQQEEVIRLSKGEDIDKEED